MILITALINVEVGFRFFLNLPLASISEIVSLLFPWVSLLGAAVAVQSGSHMALHLLRDRMTPGVRIGLRAFVTLMTVGFGLFLIVQGFTYSMMTRGELTNVLDVSRSWEIAAFPVSGILMVLYSLRSFFAAARRQFTADLAQDQF